MTNTGLLLASLAATALASQEAPQRPTFKASTELVLIDTQVVAKDGSPITGLKPDQFEVFIDGRRQPVVAAEFIRTDGTGAPPASPAAAVASPEQPGRTIVLAVDQASFPMSGQASAREAATRIINSVAPEDSLGMVVFPGPIAIAPTRDRSALKEAVPNISGKRVDLVTTRFNISASEASQLRSRDAMATRDVTSRECRLDATNPTCVQEVIQDAGRIADTLEQQAMLSVSGLHGVLDAMEALPGRKTLMLVSAGLPMRPGGTPDLNGQTTEIGRRAAAANVNLYVFYMNVHFLRAFSAEYGKRNNSLFEDITMFGYGLEKFADSTGGSFAQVEVDSDPHVARALRETSAAYVLAVQVRPEDRDGKDHFIRVAVKQRGSTVRYRRMVNIPTAGR